MLKSIIIILIIFCNHTRTIARRNYVIIQTGIYYACERVCVVYCYYLLLLFFKDLVHTFLLDFNRRRRRCPILHKFCWSR